MFDVSIADATSQTDVMALRNTVVLAVGPLVGVDPASGANKWLRTPADGLGQLPSTSDDSLVYPATYRGLGAISAIDPRNGTTQWTSSVLPRDTTVTSADYVRVFGPNKSGSLLAASFTIWKGSSTLDRGGVALLDAHSGVQRWSSMLPVKNSSVSTTPVRAAIGSGVVAVTSWEGFVYAYDESSGALRWTGATARLPASGQQFADPDIREVAISGQVVVAGSGSAGLTGYDVRTRSPLWNVLLPSLGGVYRLVAVTGGRVIALHFAGGISLVESSSGNVLWTMIPNGAATRVNGLRASNDTLFTTSIVGGLTAWKLP
jgi:outer membrane protein assembly factor BamB